MFPSVSDSLLFQIVFQIPTDSGFYRPLWVLGTLLLITRAPLVAQEAAAPALGPLPERFFQVQDKSGFFWQALDNGALISGETQYLQSGFNLIVDGEPFAPAMGAAREPGAGERIDVRLEEKRSLLTIHRDLWFDTERSGVRILDTFTNTGTTERIINVVLRTTYPFAWQSLHGSGGRVLGSEPGRDLRPSDQSLGVHFSPSEGRHDTFFLIGSEKGGQLPEIKTSANLRELVMHYSLAIPPGSTRALVHWVLQRNLADLGEDAAMVAPFIQRGQWLDAGVAVAQAGEIVNLTPAALLSEAKTGSNLRSLVGLNEWSDLNGFYRRAEDILARGPSSQVGGTLVRKGELVVDAAHLGEVPFTVEQLAAVAGGGGEGREPRWFLRDGRVYVGPLRKGELRWIAGGTAEEAAELLDPAEIGWLLAATAQNDGTPPAKATHFVQLVDDSVLALEVDAATPLEWGMPWGRLSLPVAEIVEAVREEGELPLWRLRSKQGDCHGVLPVTASWPGTGLGGKALELPSSLITRIWTTGATPLLARKAESDWVEFAEVPAGLAPAQGLLARGNHLIAGVLASGDVSVRDGSSVFAIDSTRIESLLRLIEPGKEGLFLVTLGGGEKIEVALMDTYLSLRTSRGVLELPTEQVLAYRNNPTP